MFSCIYYLEFFQLTRTKKEHGHIHLFEIPIIFVFFSSYLFLANLEIYNNEQSCIYQSSFSSSMSMSEINQIMRTANTDI